MAVQEAEAWPDPEAGAGSGEEELYDGAGPLTEEEEAAREAVKGTKGDWGPVFVYGSMLFPSAWSDLIGRLPDMRSATLQGWERRSFITSGFAGIFEQPGAKVIGMLVTGLRPRERLLLDAVIDDAFVLADAIVEPTGDAEARLVVSECGIAEFNGRYLPDGVKDGRTCYRREHPSRSMLYRTIHFEDGCWHLATEYEGYFYKATWDGKMPPEDGWVIDADGITPVPRIAKEFLTIECTMYAVRESCMDCIGDDDWDFDGFGEQWLEGFSALCRDTQVAQRDAKLEYEDLKELALARRRRQTGYEEAVRGRDPEGKEAADLEEDDPDAIDHRLGVEFPSGIIRLRNAVKEEHIQPSSWVKLVVDPLPNGTGRTPQQEKVFLEEKEKVEVAKWRRKFGAKWPQEPSAQEAGALIASLRDGTRKMYGEELQPLVTGGLPPTPGSDFCVVSLPYQRYDWYAHAVIICATFRIGMAVVSEAHYQDVWLFIWKRNVDRLVREHKTLVVLTQLEHYGTREDKPGVGNVEFSQSVQVLYLREKGYDFVAVDIMNFCRNLQPMLTAASEDDYDFVEQCLMSRKSFCVPLVNVADPSGRTTLHYAARLGPSERVLRMLVEAGEDVNGPQWACDEYCPGWTPLHIAAKFGPPRMVRLLFENKADAHARTASGKTVFDLARGRADNERMVSQCHWKFCQTCNNGEDTAAKGKPLPSDTVAKDHVPSSAIHAAHCHICSRFT